MSEPLEHVKSTLQTAHVFDVDDSSGFMPPEPPLSSLPRQWSKWEEALGSAISEERLQLADKLDLTPAEAAASKKWRRRIREMPTLSIHGLDASAVLLRRAHLVLAYILHFYVQTIPLDEPILIPSSISVPILSLSQILDIPPVLTFSDTVLYNWDYVAPQQSDAQRAPDRSNIRSQTLFTGLKDEEEFYLCSARIELRGTEVLELMRMTMDETFVGDAIAAQRIAKYLATIANVIDELKEILFDVKKGCNPDVYYNQVRPWFRGEDSDERRRKWVFEVDGCEGLRIPTELSGPSAGQSSLVHVLDIFLGVDHQASASANQKPFMDRMQTYMPRNHRLFLDHLKANPRPLRGFVMDARDESLLDAYNTAVAALKSFRDAHMIIVTLYILGPARRARMAASKSQSDQDALKGTGGTDLVKFLKDTKTRTTEALIQVEEELAA